MGTPISVIFTTYNQPAWLQKVLWGFDCQQDNDFEIVIADDGSGPDTRNVIDQFKNESQLEIKHVWHEDVGYGKCQILNKSILEASGSYLIFTDGDCIPRNDFVSEHKQLREKGHFLSGGAVRLPLDTSHAIERNDVYSQVAFDKDWLIDHGLEKNYFKNLKLTKSKATSKLMNAITPAKATWNGGNASGWKEDILSVNGFDERMKYGGQDRELGERLINKGIIPKQLRFSAICLHLDHSRGYKSEASIKFNQGVRKETRENHSTWTDYGIVKEKAK